MTLKDNILGILAGNQADDAAELADFDARFNATIARIFAPVSADMDAHAHREYWLKGGRGSTKSTYAACKTLQALKHDRRASALILRKVGNTMRDSVFAQMLWAMDALRDGDSWDVTVSPMAMTHKKTGQQIIFRGLDEPRKIKSIKPRRGYFGIVWFEEADELQSYDEMHSIMESTARGKGAQTEFIVSYNPPKSANNWINKEALSPKSSRLVHHSCYLDVPPEWLSEAFLREAAEMREKNEVKWRHVYGGEATGDGGNVFANLEIRDITKGERLLLRPMYGLDFGYSNDPSALMTVAYRSGDNTLFLLDEYYKAGAGFAALTKECLSALKAGGSGAVWADTEPRTIAELKERGVPVAAARKGQKSRTFGMEWLEELDKIVIDKTRCPNAAREFSAFEHAKTASGEWRADYQDGNDHTIDATRYACWEVIFSNRRKKYYSGKGAR